MKIYSEAELRSNLNLSDSTLPRWRKTGEGPRFVRLGPRRIGYRVEDVEEWLMTRTYPHRAAELAGARK